jgi:UDP-2,4-diacetamido-2,4,6-trideoxy-beta-L-altropyranose hydrolase
MVSVPQLLIRTDASTRVGTGHVMRMLALAQAWQQRGGEVRFVYCECPAGLQIRLRQEGFSSQSIPAEPGSLADLDAFLRILKSTSGSYVALDGYQFGFDYQQSVRRRAAASLVVDDYGHLGRYSCDILLNQNPTAGDLNLQARAGEALVLQGLTYALLRREYLNHPRQLRGIGDGPLNLLVTLGGSDENNITGKILRSLRGLEDQIAGLRVLVGAANPHQSDLRAYLRHFPCPSELLVNVTDMPGELARADAAICAGGSTCWEMAYMGVPVAVVTLAENQHAIGTALEKMGAAVLLGHHKELTRDSLKYGIARFLSDNSLLERISEKLHSLVDGRGASRVVVHLQSLDVILSPGTEDDSRRIWELANDPTVRRASFLSDPIPWAQHEVWYRQKLKVPGVYFLIASDRMGNFIGVVRFEPDQAVARISIAVDPAARGAGTGTAMIISGCQWMFNNTDISRINAYIRPENKASRSAFQTAGFQFVSEASPHDQNALRYVLEKVIPPTPCVDNCSIPC